MVTEEDLKRLPLRAIVAFAARCARRVLPLYLPHQKWPDAADFKRAVELAVLAAERTAEGNYDPTIDPSACSGEASVAADGPDATAYLPKVTAFTRNAGRAASNAADVAAVTIAAGITSSDAAAVRFAVRAVNAALAGARAGTEAVIAGAMKAEQASSAFARATDSDFRKLVELDLGEYPAVGRTVDPSASGPLGPLWPDGEPEWLATAATKLTAPHGKPPIGLPPVTAYLDPGTAPQELITEFYLALSAVYQSRGGSPLMFVSDETRSLVGAGTAP
jgi:hypothetical protein